MNTMIYLIVIIACLYCATVLAIVTSLMPTILSKRWFSDLEIKFIKNNINFVRVSGLITIGLILSMFIYEYFMY